MSLATQAYALPLARPVRTARGELRIRRGFAVRIADRDGRVGLGESAPLPPWTEDLKACAGALEDAADALGAVGDADEALDKLDIHCRALQKAPAARHGLALALLDLAARQADEPLADYLARTRLKGRLGSRDVAVNALVGADAPEDAALAAKEASLRGFRCFKLKLADSALEDNARAAAVRGAIGDAELRLDANGAWSLAEAETRLSGLAEHRPAYVEQPVADVMELKALRARRIVPVAADECAASVASAMRVLSEGAADVLVVKPMALGGPDRAVDVLLEARARGVPAVVTTLLDGPIARAGALHVAALLPEPRPACGLTMLELPGAPPASPTLPVPTTPGLGRLHA